MKYESNPDIKMIVLLGEVKQMFYFCKSSFYEVADLFVDLVSIKNAYIKKWIIYIYISILLRKLPVLLLCTKKKW